MSYLAASLVTLYPNTRSVQLFAHIDKRSTPPKQVVQTLSRAVRGWGKLVHGSFTILDARAYKHLCRLKTLTSLRICIHNNYAPIQAAKLPAVPFSALTDVNTQARTITDLVQLINRHNHFPLVSNLTCEVEVARSQLLGLRPYDLCKSIAARFRCQSLQRVHLRLRFRIRKIVVHLNAIRPLFVFSRLRSVNLSGFCMLSLDDNELEILASSWPLLEELNLSRRVLPKHKHFVQIPTFTGLFKLIEHCPHLRVLTIVIDVRDIAGIGIQKPCGYACTRMVSQLDLSSSLINDLEQVASILKAIFPLLKEVYVDTLPQDDSSGHPRKEFNIRHTNLIYRCGEREAYEQDQSYRCLSPRAIRRYWCFVRSLLTYAHGFRRLWHYQLCSENVCPL